MGQGQDLQSDWSEALKVAVGAASKARELLLHYRGQLTKVSEKHLQGLVSEADRESEALIAKHLKAYNPNFSFLGEEEAYDHPQLIERSRQAEGLWIVDPLDGTTNYIHGFPIFCISIGLVVRGQAKVAVIDVPCLNETYTAVAGEGAKLNGKSIHVSSAKDLSSSLTGTGFFIHNETELKDQLAIFAEVVRRSRGVRRPGAAAYDLCLVASGVFDLFWERNLKPWDTAAGWLLVKEAGGAITDYEGNEFHPFQNTIVASNNKVHSEFLKLISEQTKK